jgi:hypothetical protein
MLSKTIDKLGLGDDDRGEFRKMADTMVERHPRMFPEMRR